jgi:tetratricopeptide (TPR) repeat protein
VVTTGTLAGATTASRADDQAACFNQGVGDENVAACTRLITSNTIFGNNLAQAYLRRCFLYARRPLADLEHVLEDCNEVLWRQPNNAGALTLRAAYYVRKDDLDRALSDLNEALRLRPQDSGVHNVFGQYWLAKGDLDRALSELNEAIRINPGNGFAYRNRGLVYEKKGDLDQAMADFRTALRQDPNRSENIGRDAADGIERVEKRLAALRQPPEPQPQPRVVPTPSPAPTMSTPSPSAGPASEPARRVALVIGNADYPDADPKLTKPAEQARTFADDLRRSGYEVEIGENLSKQALQRTIEAFVAKITPSSVALLFFSGYGIQADRQTYILPVDAQVWTERDVVRDGVKLETILRDMHDKGAADKLVIVDASRRNPYERRFRGVSVGLAPVTAPAGSLVIYSAAPGQVATEDSGLFVSELSKEIRAPNVSAEEAFIRTRVGVSNHTRNQQIPWVSSSLTSDLKFARSGR